MRASNFGRSFGSGRSIGNNSSFRIDSSYQDAMGTYFGTGTFPSMDKWVQSTILIVPMVVADAPPPLPLTVFE